MRSSLQPDTPCADKPHSNSGRCWLFAQCNVIRTQIMAQYDLDKFELSQSYRESRAWHSASVQA